MVDHPNTLAVHLNGARDEVIAALTHLAPKLDHELDAVRSLLFALCDLEAMGRELDEQPEPASVVELVTPGGGRKQ